MTSKIGSDIKRVRGRPKAFDREQAVQAAMMLFWEHGYEGTSYDDLTAAMGINPSSFRNTFKSKEALFREATSAYVAETGAWFAAVLSGEPDVRAAFARLLDETAALYTRADRPAGCLIALAVAHTPTAMAPLKDWMTNLRRGGEAAMVERIQQGQRDGQVGNAVDSVALGAFLHTVFRGMAVQARDGASEAALRAIAQVAMGAFPPRAAAGTPPAS